MTEIIVYTNRDNVYSLNLRTVDTASHPIISMIIRLLTTHSPLRLPCRYRAAWRLLRKAAELVQPPVVEITEAELQALVDELDAERAAGYLAPSVYAEGAGVFVNWSNHGCV